MKLLSLRSFIFQDKCYYIINHDTSNGYKSENKFIIKPGEFYVYIAGDCCTENKIKIEVI